MEYLVIYFDGICYLCNSAVNFLIKIDKGNKFKFSPLQSDFAREQLKMSRLNSAEIDSIILQKGDSFYIKSKAVKELIKELSWYWRVFLILSFLPDKTADKLYDFIARQRYKWFGKKESCMVPSPEFRSRFIID